MADSDLVRLIKKALGENESPPDPVTAEKSLSYAPVWYAISKISGHIGYLPLNKHQQKSRGIRKITDFADPGYYAMRVKANAYQTPVVFRRQVMVHALLWGNGRAKIHRDEATGQIELLPLMPDRTVTLMVAGAKVHVCQLNEDDRLWNLLPPNMRPGPTEAIVFDDDQVLHIPGLGVDGVEGLVTAEVAKQSWGVGLGFEKHLSGQQKRGYAGGLMLKAPHGAFRKEDDAREFLRSFREAHAGSENASAIGLLRDGIEAQVLAQTNDDSQLIEHRKFQRQEAALWFLLESILGDDASVSYNSLEQKNLAYLQNCLSTWLKIWEEECDTKLLTLSEQRRGYYFKFNDGALLRTDKMTTAQYISTLTASRTINPNEGRDMIDLDPYEGGDEFANPAVTPGSPGQSRQAERRAANVAAAWLKEMVNTEANRVIDLTKSANFLRRLDEFYARWQPKLEGVLKAIGLDQELAAKHCDESKSLLLEVAGKVQQEQLHSAVGDCVANWAANRVDGLLETELAAC